VIRCPKCGSQNTIVYKIRGNPRDVDSDVNRRTRRCKPCGHGFETVERVRDGKAHLRHVNQIQNHLKALEDALGTRL